MCILPRRLLPSCRKWACEIKWTPAAYAPPLWCRPTLPIPLQSAYPSPMKGFTLPTHNPSDVVPCWASLNYVGLHGAFTCVPPLLFRSMLRILLQCADLLQCPPLHLVPLAWPTTMLKLRPVFTKRPRIKDIRAPIVFTYTFLPAHTYYSFQGLLLTLLLARDIICPLKLHIARMKKDHVHYFIIDVKKNAWKKCPTTNRASPFHLQLTSCCSSLVAFKK